MILRVVDKQKPHYSLSTVKALFKKKKTQIVTRVARKNAVSAGYTSGEDIEAIIERLRSEHFYKSMTQRTNHTMWQDVYLFRDGDQDLYIKVQLTVDGKKAVLIQMKNNEGSDE